MLEHWNDYDLILTSSHQSALNINKQKAAQGSCGAFGVIAQSLGSWISTLWDENGSERIFIDDLLRILYVQRAIQACEPHFSKLELTPTLANSLAVCFRDSAGLPIFDAACATSEGQFGEHLAPDQKLGEHLAYDQEFGEHLAQSEAAGECVAGDFGGIAGVEGTGDSEDATGVEDAGDSAGTLTAVDTDILMVRTQYFYYLADNSFIEAGQALRFIAEHPEKFFPDILGADFSGLDLGDADSAGANFESAKAKAAAADKAIKVALCLDEPLNMQYQLFFEKLAEQNILQIDTYLESAESFIQKEEDVKLRFAFPSGRYAQAKLLLKIIREHSYSGSPENSSENLDGCSPYLDLELGANIGAGADKSADAGVDTGKSADAGVDTGKSAGTGSIVIASTHPMRLYHQLVEPLAKGKGSAHNKALSCSVCANKPFLQTQLGKAVFALYRVYLTAGFPWDTNALSDVLHSSFLALPKQRVYNLDAFIRGNRLMSRDEALEILRGSSDEVSGILRGSSVDSDSASTSPDEPVSKDDSKPKSSGIEAFRILENLLIKHDEESFNAAFKRVQSLQSVGALTQEQATESFGVLQIMRSSCERAALAGVVDLPDLMAIYQSMSVVLNFCSTELSYAQHADVRIMTRSAAAKLPPRCCDTLILCDETSAENPLSRHENAVDLFLKKFGYTQAESIVNAERRKFLHLLDLAKDSLIIERQLLDDEASSSYFSAMAQEFINAYRKPEDLETGDDIDNVFQIPQFLQEGMYTCGEYEVDGAQDLGAQAGKASNLDEALGADKGTSFDKRAAKRTAKEAAPDKNTDLMQMIYAGLDLQEFSPLSTKDAIYAYLPQGSALKNNVAFRNTEEFPVNKDSLPRLSASQIELYMQCPFKWFVERRLNISALDENFGPITLGTLIHSCFELFYERFKEQTQCNKVTVDTLEQAKDIMAASFDEVYKKQCSNKYCGRRHAAQPETSEELEIASLKEQLIEWLEFEVDFLPEFEQALSEFKIKPEEAVFANAKWSGSIDRVDVRKNDGAIAIIDYKGSLKDSYLPTKKLRGGKKEYTENRGSKIQAALYLLILRDLIKSNAQSIQESDNARALFGAQVETVQTETAQVPGQAQSEVETAQVIGQAQSGVETAQGAGKAQSEVALPQEIRVHAAQEALCAALYVSYKRGHDVIGLINNDILKYDFVDKKNYNRMAFSGGSSQIEPETKGGHAKNEPLPENLWQSEHPSFNTVLEGIELRVGEAVKNLRNAQIYPAPISKEPCEYCTMQACPMRET